VQQGRSNGARLHSAIPFTMVSEMAAGGVRSLTHSAALSRWPIIAALLVGLCTAATRGTADGGKAAGGTMLNALADSSQSSFSLPSLDGPPHELVRLRGRVVLIHFFATWCEPCREEMASLRELQLRLEGRPFTIVPVSVAEADGAVRRFFAGESLPFAILLDRDRAVARAWNIHTLPSTVVLDRTLKPRFIAEGDVDWARPDVTNILTDLLTEVPG
jgi:peroxiredoxin